MENILDEVCQNLVRRGFKARVVADGDEAMLAAAGIIGKGSVGIGGSLTVKECGLAEELKARGNKVFWHWLDGPEARRAALSADFYVCSANALTADGVIALTDGSGNRVAALSFGPRNAILIIGKNKIVADEREAVMRIRSAECAGANAKRLGLHTPCADLGRCDDCASPDRICSVTAFFERPAKGLENTYVLLVDRNMGL